MKNLFIRTLLILIGIIKCMCASSQHANYLTQLYGTRNGLNSPYIYKLMQDSKHYLWVGTKIGASRFNGYEFENFQFTADQRQIGKIIALAEDVQQRIWFGGEKGLFVFQNGSVQQIVLNSTTPSEVEALTIDRQGNILAGSNSGVFRITANSIDAIPFLNFNGRVTGLAVDETENIYIGTYEGIYFGNSSENKLKQVWKNTDISDYVRSITVLSADTVFWVTREGKVYQMAAGNVTGIAHDEYLFRNIFTRGPHTYGLVLNKIVEVVRDKVVTRYDMSSLTNFAADALLDAEGIFWAGTWEGLFKFRPALFNTYQLKNTDHPEVFSFLETESGKIYFGGNRGRIFSRYKNEIIPDEELKQRVFPMAEVLCMFEDAGRGLWFGSGYNGISHLTSKKLTHYTDADSLGDNSCYSFYHTKQGKLIACTGNGAEEIAINNPNPSFIHYGFKEPFARPPELYGGFETLSGNLFLYSNQGLFTLKDNQLHQDSISGFAPKYFNIKNIIRDKHSNIWIATQGKGLLLCKEKNNRLYLLKQFSKVNGLNSDVVLSVLADKNDDIWISNYNGLTLLKYDGSFKIFPFNETDGLLSSYYQDLKLYRQQNGTIWGVSTLGLLSFHPDSFSFSNVKPVVQIDDVLLFDGKYSIDKYRKNQPTGRFRYSLPYNMNSISFAFTSVSLTESSKNQYAYRLKGLDSVWYFSRNRKAVFNFLPPGHYLFEVKGSNSYDEWSDPVTGSFVINPPWWKTTWFNGILLFATAMVIFLAWREWDKRRKRKIEMLEKDKKLRELKMAMDDARIKAIRSQMNPHFIFNCMNAIQKLIFIHDEENATDYLSRFSKLLRMVLNHSDKTLIPLSEDMEVNRLYLELEALRFQKEISFSIIVSPNIDDEDTLMPGMLIQPFLENALIHGLLNKNGNKSIRLEYVEEGNNLCCRISDNGIGRKKAMEIKSQKLGSAGHQSKGIKLSLQRIELLNQQSGRDASIIITDNVDENGNATGTTVSILLPLDLSENQQPGKIQLR